MAHRPAALVLDASALFGILIGAPPARDVLDRAPSPHVPELIEAEVLHTLRRHVRRSLVTMARAGEALEDLGDLGLVRHRHGPLRNRAWALGPRFSAYDAFYVALAEALGAVLVTADARLARAAAGLVEVDLVTSAP